MTLSALKTSQHENNPRLEPIENPKSLKLKMAYWFTKRRIGKVITPVKVHYSRFPEGIGLSAKMIKTEEKISLDPKLKHLIKVYIATINGCAFCVDIGKAFAQNNHVNPGLFDDLFRFEESSQFTDAEKAALAFVDETTRNKHVDNATFERLQIHFNEREIVQITILNAIENFYNLVNIPMNIGSDKLCELM